MRRARKLTVLQLRRPRIRQSWSKVNLYHLATFDPLTATGSHNATKGSSGMGSMDENRASTNATTAMARTNQLFQSVIANRTYFQQKWWAKSLTRVYHGEQVSEKAWQNMFSTRLPAVYSIRRSPAYQNHHASSSSSRQIASNSSSLPPSPPYMQMLYYPLERRLDTAVFRAMFATSIRQARQFCIHGHVNVNGRRIRAPGYMLRPGDLFTVDPIRVLHATHHHHHSIDSTQDSLDSFESPESSSTPTKPDPSESQTNPTTEHSIDYFREWKPRNYMSAFALIPRYLEVHHRICAAVYLRDPVARPGYSEIPSPFPYFMHQLAFNWYLRRR